MKKLVILGLVLLLMPDGYEHGNIPVAMNGILKRQQSVETLDKPVEDAIQNSWSRFKRAPGKSSRDNVDSYESLEAPPAPPEPGHSHEHGHHLLDHIRDEIHRGHVTQDNMIHWWTQIKNALQNGSVTKDEVNRLMASLEHSDINLGSRCCWFG
ncbi:uncharacterized protein LOC123561363 [Mercenaria mercenaria]|uniref:uncharacterized protein LOC123561363 n=1 Tax=Mercenaria mercenaria TaxID=6596 RepID=UPI001E1DC260|nr:uncharacterized protein LOC123561363 [Mercenaria mercenaria]